MPFEFPTGRELLRQRKDQNSAVLRGMVAGISPEEAERLHLALRQSEDNSIDSLLEHRQDLERVGKLVIAATLLGKELGCIDKTVRDRDWIQYLLSLMTEGTTSAEDFAHNAVTFITYNYDRLIEYKMMNNLRAKWQTPDEDLFEIIPRIPVIHLHGLLGTIGPGPKHVPFGALPGPRKPTDDIDPRSGWMHRAAGTIRIVHQVKDDDPQFTAAREALKGAKTIFILGFGFGPDNVRRLDLRNLPEQGVLYATRAGMTDQEYKRYFIQPLERAMRNQLLGGGSNDIDDSWDCLRLLREFVGVLV